MADDRDASISDATFREAVDAYATRAIEYHTGFFTTEAMVAAARARVLALYAERLGEVYEATDIHNRHGIRVRVIKVPPQEFGVGDRVRVTKVEDAK